jgi:SAM-dependent methyltransferase
MPSGQVFLHVGCGPARKDRTTRTFAGPDWRELRLDIDASVAPDIVGSMTDMAGVATGAVDAVFSSHNIEHLHAHEVPLALAEFRRVLRPDGFLVITCPDLQSVAAFVAQDRLLEPLCNSPAGGISALDILYGHRAQVAAGNQFMAHRYGFSRGTLRIHLGGAGFASVVCISRGAPHFDIWAVALKRPASEAELSALAEAHFPS